MKPARPYHAVLAPIAGLLVLATSSFAADGDEGLASEMNFARKLAERFAYVDLAQEVITDLESRGLDGKNAEGLALLRCDVFASGARAERKADQRLVLYSSAIKAYEGFLDVNGGSDYAAVAQKSYVNLINSYGRARELQLDELLGAEAATAREEIKDVLDNGVDLIENLIDETDGASTSIEKAERWRLMMYRGQMLLTLANVSEDGTYFYANAETSLENLVGEAGEVSGYGLNAFLLLSKVKMAQGLWAEASDFAGYVLDLAVPVSGTDGGGVWDELTFDEKAIRWTLAEQAASIVIEAYQLQDNYPSSCGTALHFYNTWKREGFTVSPQGHLALLAAARSLFASDGFVGGRLTGGSLRWFASADAMKQANFSGNRNARSALDFALRLAKEVNDENKGNTLQTRAQKVISEIISMPGVDVSMETLFEAAQGDFFAKDYDAALTSFRRIMHQLDSRDQATQLEFTPKVLFHIGRSLQSLDRDLEAAMAFREGATTWRGDPDYDEQLANRYYSSIGRVRTASSSDPLVQNLYLEAENLLRTVGSQTGAIAFRQAERAYGNKDYTEARKRFLEVEEGSVDYEMALVKAALCHYKQKDQANAAREFSHYLDVYVADPRTKPVDAVGRGNRSKAMSLARFYLGRIAYDAAEWKEVIKHFETFAKDFPEQDNYAATALYMLTKAHLSLADLFGAQGVVAEMREKFGSHSRTGLAAAQIYIALDAEHAAAETAEDADRAMELKNQMAEYKRLANELDDTPSYGALRAESKLWIELGKWTEAEAVLIKLAAKFPDKGDIFMPDMGLALMELKRVPEAFRALDPLIPKEDSDTRKPSSSTRRRWCRSVTGWVEGEGDPVLVPGTGGTANLEIAAKILRQLTDSEGARVDSEGARGKFTAAWYELKFETAYAYRQWGVEDSAQTKNVKILIENLQSLTASKRLTDVAEKCGNDTLQKRFLWLLNDVK